MAKPPVLNYSASPSHRHYLADTSDPRHNPILDYAARPRRNFFRTDIAILILVILVVLMLFVFALPTFR